MKCKIFAPLIIPWDMLTVIAKTFFFSPYLCFSEESDDKLSKSKNDSAGKFF